MTEELKLSELTDIHKKFITNISPLVMAFNYIKNVYSWKNPKHTY